MISAACAAGCAYDPVRSDGGMGAAMRDVAKSAALAEARGERYGAALSARYALAAGNHAAAAKLYAALADKQPKSGGYDLAVLSALLSGNRSAALANARRQLSRGQGESDLSRLVSAADAFARGAPEKATGSLPPVAHPLGPLWQMTLDAGLAEAAALAAMADPNTPPQLAAAVRAVAAATLVQEGRFAAARTLVEGSWPIEAPAAATAARTALLRGAPETAPGGLYLSQPQSLAALSLRGQSGPADDSVLVQLALVASPRPEDLALTLAASESGVSEFNCHLRRGLLDTSSERRAPEAPRLVLEKMRHALDCGNGSAEALPLTAEALTGLSPEERILAASLLTRSVRPGEALAVLEQARADDADAALEKARALSALGRWPEAETTLRRAMLRQPFDAGLLQALGEGLAERPGSAGDGLRYLQQAAKLSPASPEIRSALGFARLQAGHLQEAAFDLEDAVALEPTDPVALSRLGDAYWRMSRFSDARREWLRAENNAPGLALARELEVKLRHGLRQ